MSSISIIPTENIVERLRYENPWWINKRIPEVLSTMSKRLYFNLFYPFVIENKIRRALVLIRPRRVGKTVMLFHSIQELLNENINPQKYFLLE